MSIEPGIDHQAAAAVELAKAIDARAFHRLTPEGTPTIPHWVEAPAWVPRTGYLRPTRALLAEVMEGLQRLWASDDVEAARSHPDDFEPGTPVVDVRNGCVGRVLGTVTGVYWVRPLGGGDKWSAEPNQLRRARHYEVSREWTGRTR